MDGPSMVGMPQLENQRGDRLYGTSGLEFRVWGVEEESRPGRPRQEIQQQRKGSGSALGWQQKKNLQHSQRHHEYSEFDGQRHGGRGRICLVSSKCVTISQVARVARVPDV